MKRALLLLPLVGLLLFANSCKKDDNDNSGCSGSSFSATIDGTAFNATSFNNTLLVGEDQITGTGVEGIRLDVRATDANGKQLIISVTNLENGVAIECVKEEIYYEEATDNYCGNNGCEGIIITLMDGNTASVTSFSGDGIITITNCDEAGKNVSGTFSAELTNFSTGDPVEVSGSFNNQCFAIIK